MTASDRLAKKRAWDRQQKAFRDQVWLASGNLCASCGQHVRRGVDWWERGEVDHIRPRSLCTRLEKIDPANGQVLCVRCHHRKTTRGSV